MAVDREEVRGIARLARLDLTAAETERLTGELGKILDYFAQIQACNTEGVSAELDPERNDNVLREDELRPGLARTLALKNAPETDGHYFRVPPVLPKTDR